MLNKKLAPENAIYSENEEKIDKHFETIPLLQKYQDVGFWKNIHAKMEFVNACSLFGEPDRTDYSLRSAYWTQLPPFYKALQETRNHKKVDKIWNEFRYVSMTISDSDPQISLTEPVQRHALITLVAKVPHVFPLPEHVYPYEIAQSAMVDQERFLVITRGFFFYDCLMQMYLILKWCENPEWEKADLVRKYTRLYKHALINYRLLLATGKEFENRIFRNMEAAVIGIRSKLIEDSVSKSFALLPQILNEPPKNQTDEKVSKISNKLENRDSKQRSWTQDWKF